MDGKQSLGFPPFLERPSPWHATADVFTCLSVANWTNGLPSGSYGDVEASSDFVNREVSGEYTGGPGSVMIVRYSETPVGPYDEIIWIPGYFQVPGTDQKRPRITRIYVSLVDSVYNGRKNWNIPKELANFNFIPSSSPTYPPYQRVEISHPSNPEELFVSLDLRPIPLLSRPLIPISSAYVPLNIDLAIPPIPQSNNWKKDGRVGTAEWRYTSVSFCGWAGLVNVQGRVGDGKAFPQLNLGSYWTWIKDAHFSFHTLENL